MSTAFSTALADWPKLSYLTEIDSGLDERSEAIGVAYTSQLSGSGMDVQNYAIFKYWQERIEAICTYYVDYGIGGGNFDGLSTVPMFTLASFRSRAGLNANGFKRSTNGTSFAYGVMQPGDVIGSWIFTELRAALSALRWSKATWYDNRDPITFYYPDSSAIYVANSGPDCATVLANHEALWAAEGWTQPANAIAEGAISSNGTFVAESRRTRGFARFTFAVSRERDFDFYVFPHSPREWQDIDGLGFLEDKIKKMQSVSGSTALTWSSDTIGDISASAISASGISCPLGTTHERGWTIGDYGPPGSGSPDVFVVAKWNFTNI